MHYDIKINDQLLLSKMQYRYAHDIVEAMQDVEIYLQTLKIPFPYFLADAIGYIDHIKEIEAKHKIQKEWAILYQNKMIGAIGLHFDKGVDSHISEIGYWLNKDYRGQGWMSLVLSSFTAYVFKNMKIIKLKAVVFDSNLASIKSLENSGFVKEAIFQKEYVKDGKMINAISLGLHQ